MLFKFLPGSVKSLSVAPTSFMTINFLVGGARSNGMRMSSVSNS